MNTTSVMVAGVVGNSAADNGWALVAKSHTATNSCDVSTDKAIDDSGLGGIPEG